MRCRLFVNYALKSFWFFGAVALVICFGCSTRTKDVPVYVGMIESIADKPGAFYFANGKEAVQAFWVRIVFGELKGTRVELLMPGLYDEREGRVGDRVRFRCAENLALVRVVWRGQVLGYEVEDARKSSARNSSSKP